MRRHFRPTTSRRILSGDALRQLFSACCESAFTVELGVADPPIVDYMSRLLVRFVHVRTTAAVRSPDGSLVDTFTGLVREAEARRGASRRRLHQRIGDLTLFWTGVYPEALPQVQSLDSPDAFLDLPGFGRRSYELAAGERSSGPEERSLLWRLAEEYETCRDGLTIARRTWEEMAIA